MTLRDDVSERAEARVGITLKGKWRLDSVIGIGGMATVYAATHRNRSRVAIKMLHPEVAVSQDVTSRFLREGYVGNQVVHAGTVKVLDDDITEDGAPFLVMELLEGESLGARLDRDGPLPPYEVALLADQLLDVLAAAHAAHIVHRDLKPDNVFLTLEGRVKVLDFGIARLRSLAESSASTQAGSLLGTPAFMAPEQALGRWKDVDERTDIWAIGATLFNLLTGRFVHEADAVQEQLVLAATSKAPPLQLHAPNAPPWLCHIVDRALAFGRDVRFPDARSMQAALRATAQDLDFPVYPLSVPGASASRSSWQQTPPATPRPLSSPSFGEGATLVASEPVPSVAGAGTFASVQAVARSAQEPAPAPHTNKWLVALATAAGVGIVATITFVLLSQRASLRDGGVSLPTAAALPVSASPIVSAAPVLPPPQETATKQAPPAPSASARVAANVVKPHVTSSKKPPATPKPLPPANAPPPEHRQNLFDIRH
jgi:eukaryotic-like serine/threonine-protein kinase